MLRRIIFLMASVAMSIAIVVFSNVAKRQFRHGEPLIQQTSEMIGSPAERVDLSTVGALPVPTAARMVPTQSIFGPSASSANPAPPSVNVQARELSATPLPSAPLIAGNATESVTVTKSKENDQ